ncbi:hypothetical protein MJG53_010066 [Ovis ammon polii x Ovis aries]|uniref:Uncharacterized protein n=1 Tax=Ovis ammon polii x Ovis aries TaxID=2918886 RepID=A0ACB9UVT7_9CETA|nr:hypothetical protein MJG53_010066 [Ovis ammon polii x Ovis aries]
MSAWPKAAFDDGNERMKTAARCAMKNRSVENVEQTAKARSCHVPADGNSIVIGVVDSKGTSVVTGHRYDQVIFKLVSQVHSLYGIVGTALSCLGITLQAWCCEVCATGLTQALAGASLSTGERVGHRLDPGSFVRGMILLSDHLWFCAEAKLTRARDKEQQQQQQQQRQQRQRQEQRQRQRQHEPSWPALLASMGEPSPAAQAHRLLSASPSPTLPPSPGGGGGGKGGRGTDNGGKPPLPGNSARPAWRLETCYPQGASSGQCFTVESADAVCARNWSRGAAARGDQRQQTWGPPQPTPLWNLSDFYLSFCNSYTLWELFSGLSSPNTLNCSLDVVLKEGGEMTTCRQCVEAYQDYDHHAQEKYEEFESVLHKYLQSEEYSVKSCPEDCKVAPVVFRSGPPFTHSAVLSAFINCGGRGSRVKGGLGVWTGAGGRGPRANFQEVARIQRRGMDQTAVEPHQRTSSACVPAVVADENHTQGHIFESQSCTINVFHKLVKKDVTRIPELHLNLLTILTLTGKPADSSSRQGCNQPARTSQQGNSNKEALPNLRNRLPPPPLYSDDRVQMPYRQTAAG